MARKKKDDAEQSSTNTTFDTTEDNDIVENLNISADELALGNEADTQPAEPILDIITDVEDVADEGVAITVETSLDSEVAVSEDATFPADHDLVFSNETDTQPAPFIEHSEASLASEISETYSAVEASTTSTNGHSEYTDAVLTEVSPINPSTTHDTVATTEINSLSNQPYLETIGANPMASDTPSSYEDYQVMPESPWPPPIFVKRSITPQERYYIEHRWHSQWRFFDKKANDSKRLYFRLQRIVVIGSVTVPVLVSLDPDIIRGFINFIPLINLATEDARLLIDITTVLLSLAVAIAAGLESLNKYGDNWGSYRNAAEELQAEKSFYDVGGGRYANNPDAFSRFVERTEEIIAQQHGRFVASVEKQVQETEKRTDEVLGRGKDKEQNLDETVAAEPVYQPTSFG